MSNPFKAKYDGRCPSCQQVIEKDELLVWDEDHQAAVHLECAPPRSAEAAATRRPTEVCPRCFMTKAANGSCECEDGS